MERTSVASTWAYLFEHPGTDPEGDRTVIDRDGQRTLLVPVPSVDQAPEIARRLADQDGVGLIELCGGFGATDAGQVRAAVPDRVPVGHVTFAVDSLLAGAAYAQAAAGESEPQARSAGA